MVQEQSKNSLRRPKMDDNTKLAVMEGQISNFDKYLEKIDTTLEKLTEVSTSMEKMLAVHEQRIIAGEAADKDLSKAQQMIHDRVDRLKADTNTKLDKIEDKLNEIEKWRWLAVGGIALFMFVVSNSGNLMSFFMS